MSATRGSRRTPATKKRLGAGPFIVGIAALAIAGLIVWYGVGGGGAGLGRVGGDLHSLFVTADGRFMYGQHQGIQVSSDGGKTWTPPSGTGDAMALSASVEEPDIIYQAGHNLFLKSEDGGRTWQQPGFGDLPSTDIHGFAVGPEGEALYANVAGQGLHVTWDGGTTWDFVTRATGDSMTLAAGPGGPTLYAVSMSQGPIRSLDGGNTWSRIAGVPGARGVYVHPRSGNVYFAGQNGIYRSTDRGATWEELGPSVPMALVGADASDEEKLVAIGQSGQVYRSEDGGESWI